MADRRPLQTRSNQLLQSFAAWLARTAITPNQISVLSIVFAASACVLMLYSANVAGLVLAAICIQLRLLCNVLDGLVAVEGGKASPLGAVYNEVPDRIADTLIIVAAGYACHHPVLGWFGAIAAMMTAYIRALGGSFGFPQDFQGPMAKPHRMAVLTLGCLAAAGEAYAGQALWALTIASVVVAGGAVVTCWTRLTLLANKLKGAA